MRRLIVPCILLLGIVAEGMACFARAVAFGAALADGREPEQRGTRQE